MGEKQGERGKSGCGLLTSLWRGDGECMLFGVLIVIDLAIDGRNTSHQILSTFEPLQIIRILRINNGGATTMPILSSAQSTSIQHGL